MAPPAGRRSAAGRWARRNNGPTADVQLEVETCCRICSEQIAIAAPLACCKKQVCLSCAKTWAEVQVRELAAVELLCPLCEAALPSEAAPKLLAGKELATFVARARDFKARKREPPSEEQLGLIAGYLVKSGIKRCPGCGTGMQKESETCFKMMCRVCRAKFCFRCLARLEYFSCGCTGDEHAFVDPIDGSIIRHQ